MPTIYFSDGPAGPALGFGDGDALADRRSARRGTARLARRHAAVIADEVVQKGNDFVFAPTVDIVRTPLAGRVFEAIGGEDPVPGDERSPCPGSRGSRRDGLIATVKHYAGNNQEGTGPAANEARPGNLSVSLGALATVGNRMRIDARIDERTMRELYLPMFEAAVKQANVASVMCAYNSSTARTHARTRHCSRTFCAASGASRA